MFDVKPYCKNHKDPIKAAGKITMPLSIGATKGKPA